MAKTKVKNVKAEGGELKSAPAKKGPPFKTKTRSGRLSMRVYPEVEEKAKRVGTAAVERAILHIDEMTDSDAAGAGPSQ